jgi:hypothetical protein
MARTLRNELSSKFATVEIDQFDNIAIAYVLKVLCALRVQSQRPWLDPDYEYALQDGKILLPRNQWSSLGQQLTDVPHLSAARSLDIKFNGIFDSLTWAVSTSPVSERNLKKGEVEVDMKYVGMNFRVSHGVPLYFILANILTYTGHDDYNGISGSYRAVGIRR